MSAPGSFAMASRIASASSGAPPKVMRARSSPAARVHSRSNASCTRLLRAEGEVMTIALRQPSATAINATWRASWSSESDIEKTFGGLPPCGSFSARTSVRAQSLRASVPAPSRVIPATTIIAPRAIAARHAPASAGPSFSTAVSTIGGTSLPPASAAAANPWRSDSARRPSVSETVGRMSATCGRDPGGGTRGSGTGGALPSGRTTVVRARPVAGSMSMPSAAGCPSSGVVREGGSAENAGDRNEATKKRRGAVRRDIADDAGGLEPGLYVVATPIGNLGDITLRALETLKRADVIAAEDTRVTGGLLRHFGIANRPVAVHAHNERASAERIVGWIAAGRSVAFVSDAGTPGVSDPGAHLADAVRRAGQRVIPIPGASALAAALSASGLAFEGAVFAGFLPARGRERKERIAALAAAPWAIVLFEAPHRIARTLADLP